MRAFLPHPVPPYCSWTADPLVPAPVGQTWVGSSRVGSKGQPPIADIGTARKAQFTQRSDQEKLVRTVRRNNTQATMAKWGIKPIQKSSG